MTAQAGREFVLAVDSGGYLDVANCRTTDLTINDESVDITTKGSTGNWRELLAGAGTRSASISVEGVYDLDDTGFAALVAHVNAATFADCQLTTGSGETYTGDFHITNFALGGVHNGEGTFSATLESAGVITIA